MWKNSLVILAVVVLASATSVGSEEPSNPDKRSLMHEATILQRPGIQVAAKLYPDLLDHAVTSLDDRAMFADAIIREALARAATKLREEKLDTDTVSVNLEFKVRALPVSIPSPREINVCWEISTGLRSYINCAAAAYIPGKYTPTASGRSWWCEILEQDYENARQRKDQEKMDQVRAMLGSLGCTVPN